MEEIDSPQIGVIGHRIRKPQHFQKGKLVEDLPKRKSKKYAPLDCGISTRKVIPVPLQGCTSFAVRSYKKKEHLFPTSHET